MKLTRIACLPAALTALIASAGAASAAGLTVIEGGALRAPIYSTALKNNPEQRAATELARYLSLIAGTNVGVTAPGTNTPAAGIFVGSPDPAFVAGLGPDDYRIRVTAGRLDIAGGSPRATQCAVYALLEDYAGCRWWSRNEEDVPRSTVLVIPETNRVHRAPFAIQSVWNREAQTAEGNFTLKARTEGTESFSGGHTLYPLLTPYATNHTEIYPMGTNGQRRANDLHFCYIAPGIAEALADALEREVVKHRGDLTNVIYFAGMGDWYGGMCQCPECKRIYQEEKWVDPDGKTNSGCTATLIRMMNRTAGLLEAKHPGIRVGTFAYMSLEPPPGKTVPASNVVIRVPRLRHCTVHPAADCERNRRFRRNLERWCELAPGRVYVWDYAASFKHFVMPFPCLYSMASNIVYYHSRGVRGVELQGNYVDTGGDLAVLKNYVWRRLFDDPSRDPRALLREFCTGYFGPAAESMVEYVEALEGSVRSGTNSICADEFADFRYLTPAVTGRMTQARERALVAVLTDPTFTRRVQEATVSLEALTLWKAGPLKPEGNRLIRTDLGGYTYPRAKAMTEHLRGAGATEWGTGRASQMSLLAMHGGPLLTYTNGPVVVQIAPVLNGRIWQIAVNGTNLLHVPGTGPKESAVRGGCYESASTHVMELAGEPTGRSARFVGDAGIGSWSPQTKQMVEKDIGMTDDGVIWMTGMVRRVVRGEDYNRKNAVLASVFPVAKVGRPSAEYLATNGEWIALSVPAGTNATAYIPMSGWRVLLPRAGCALEDVCTFPDGATGRLVEDAKAGTLSTELRTAAVESPFETNVVFFGRQIRVVTGD